VDEPIPLVRTGYVGHPLISLFDSRASHDRRLTFEAAIDFETGRSIEKAFGYLVTIIDQRRSGKNSFCQSVITALHYIRQYMREGTGHTKYLV
jgi:hypothetical protein